MALVRLPDTRQLRGQWVCKNYPFEKGRHILQLPACGFIHSMIMMADNWNTIVQYQLTDYTEAQVLGRVQSEGGMLGRDDKIIAMTFHEQPLINVNVALAMRLHIWTPNAIKLDVLMMYYDIRG